MNEFGNEIEDDHDKILQKKMLLMENLMDRGLDDLIMVETPTQMVNLIFQQQHRQLLEGQLTKDDNYQD
jgi:hypothetical protein